MAPVCWVPLKISSWMSCRGGAVEERLEKELLAHMSGGGDLKNEECRMGKDRRTGDSTMVGDGYSSSMKPSIGVARMGESTVSEVESRIGVRVSSWSW